MENYCPKCGSRVTFNEKNNKYTCSSCGHTFYEKNIFLDEEFQNKFKSSLNSIMASPNLETNIKSFSINELKDLINLLLSDIFEIAKKDRLSEEEKVELNEKMEKILAKVIKPLINENTNVGILEYIPKLLITKNTLRKIHYENFVTKVT